MPSVRGVDLRRELAKNPPPDLSPAYARRRDEAIAIIEAEKLSEAAYSYNIVPLEQPAAETLYVAGESLYAPQLLPESGQLTGLGCGTATLGMKIEQKVSQLFSERRASLAIAMNGVAIEMLFALGRRIQDRMLSECVRKRLSMAGELNAGDPGLELNTQALMLKLSDAEKIGVSLSTHQLMIPINSITMLLGVGKDLPAVSWSRCETCPSSDRCNFGRRPRSVTV